VVLNGLFLSGVSCRQHQLSNQPIVPFDSDEDLIHPLKEVDAADMAQATTPEQVIKILKYVLTNE